MSEAESILSGVSSLTICWLSAISGKAIVPNYFPPFWKGVFSKRKEFAVIIFGSNFRVDSFSEACWILTLKIFIEQDQTVWPLQTVWTQIRIDKMSGLI